MAPPNKMSKVVTEKEIESGRISLPANVRDNLFPHVAQNTKSAATMVDEKGDSYEVVLKVRHNRTKPEIMAKGSKKFAQKRKLKPGDVLLFSRGQSGDHFKIRVKRRPCLAGFSASGSQPLALIGSDDHASSVNVPPSLETLVLGLGGPLAGSQTSVPTFGQFLIGSDEHASLPLGLGSLSVQVQPPPVNLRLSIGSDDMPVEKPTAKTVLELSLSNGSNHAPPIKPRPAASVSSFVGRIKAEVEEEGVGPTLELTLGLRPPVSVSAKFVEAAEPKFKPPEGRFLGVPVARLAADQHVSLSQCCCGTNTAGGGVWAGWDSPARGSGML